MYDFTSTRRGVLKGAAAAGTVLAAPAILGQSAFAAETITVADVGGPATEGIIKAFAEPFTKETGIKVVSVTHDPDPVTQFKLMVDTKTYLWDACMMLTDHAARLREGKNYLASLNIKDETGDMVPGMLLDHWAGFSAFAVLMAYNSEKYGSDGPKNWADFFDAGKFSGRRGLYRRSWGMIEMALLADGVKKEDLYPIDIDRAFKSLERIKKNVAVWWTSGAHNTQILQSGEVDMSDTWSARVFAAIEGGAKLTTVWQGLYSVDGWVMPINGPKEKIAREFIRFCMRPDRQAAYSNMIANGPTNRKAFDLIPPERQKLLATYPENLAGLVPVDAEWWSQANRAKVQKRFDEWLVL
jgi:putative spermidine/putrescine transport system substrate-binding protein